MFNSSRASYGGASPLREYSFSGTSSSFLKRNRSALATVAAMVAMIGGVVPLSQYADLPGFSSKNQAGRTKNAITAVVSGIVAHEMGDNAQIDLEVRKTLFPDTTVTGWATSSQISTEVPLTFTESSFTATIDSADNINGSVSKSEFDWTITQLSPGVWKIERALLKFNHTLTLSVHDGEIKGTLERDFGFDWNIQGTYDSSGQVLFTIDAPLTLGVEVEGTITVLQAE